MKTPNPGTVQRGFRHKPGRFRWHAQEIVGKTDLTQSGSGCLLIDHLSKHTVFQLQKCGTCTCPVALLGVLTVTWYKRGWSETTERNTERNVILARHRVAHGPLACCQKQSHLLAIIRGWVCQRQQQICTAFPNVPRSVSSAKPLRLVLTMFGQVIYGVVACDEFFGVF